MAELDVDLPAQSTSPVTHLTIAEIETVAIRVPLAQTYYGSAYKMTHRSTTVTRIRTEEALSARRTVATRTRASTRSTLSCGRRSLRA